MYVSLPRLLRHTWFMAQSLRMREMLHLPTNCCGHH
jgi:hypothetical protein